MKLLSHYRKAKTYERIQIAFLFQAGTVWPAIESVYRACLDDERIEVKLIYDSNTTVEKAHSTKALSFLEEKGYDYSLIEDIDFQKYIPHVAVIQFPYDAAFHTPGMLSLIFLKRGSRVVYIPYGIEIADTAMARKDHFNSRVVENAWRIYVSSEYIKNEYNKYCRNRKAVRALGAPRFDAVCHKDSFKIYQDFFKIAAGRKIILWKLHFPKKNNIDGEIRMITPRLDEYLKFADTLDKYPDVFFIVLPHPKLLNGMVGSDIHGDQELVSFGDKLNKLLSSKSNVAIDTSDDYRNSLYNADAIIIDRSAIMVETALLNKPVLYMHNPDFVEPMVDPIQRIIDTYEHGTKSEDMQRFVERVEHGEVFDLSDRQKVLEDVFPLNDGECGIRIKDDIVRAIREEEETEHILNVILYGTGEVASYYMAKQGWDSPGTFKIIAVADSDKRKQGTDYYGYTIIAPEDITRYEFDYVVVMTEPHFYDIQNKLINELYIYDKDILRLDEFVVNILPEVEG